MAALSAGGYDRKTLNSIGRLETEKRKLLQRLDNDRSPRGKHDEYRQRIKAIDTEIARLKRNFRRKHP